MNFSPWLSWVRMLGAGVLLSGGPLLATSYHVDPAGNDANDGRSPEAPWKSLARVNHTTFAPGDRILFKAGGSWSGALYPRGNGAPGAPIALDRYGDGSRPLINGGGQVEGAVRLLNQQYWEIRNLEVTNRGAAQNQYVGIKVRNCTGGELRHITIAGCAVHDINGYASGFYGANAGIAVVADMNNSIWRDVAIENNEVHDLDRVGIFVGPTWQVGGSPEWLLEPKTQNVVIRGNTVWNLGGDGILNFLTDHTLIERNVVFETGSRSYAEATGPKNPTGYSNAASAAIWNVIADNTVMQFNESYRCLAGLDGEGFDVDMGTNHTLVQYNYSHDNLGGFLLLCESGGPADINDVKVRFNISQSDGLTKGVFHISQFGFPPGPDKTQINNNTIYVPAHAKAGIKMWRPYGVKTIVGEARIYNNIFHVLGAVTYPSFDGAVFSHNIFYGVHPENEPRDEHKIVDDPRLVAPGSATLGLASVDGYKLQAGSPAIGSGWNTGAENLGDRDYWGAPVSATAAPNRGADNGAGIAGVTPNWAFNCAVSASSSEEKGAWSRQRLVDGQRISFFESAGFRTTPASPPRPAEWIVLNLGRPRAVAGVRLYPAAADAMGTAGFPRDFEIQVWRDGEWRTRVARRDFAPTSTGGQVFTWPAADETDQVRILCSNLDRPDGPRAIQLAEVEITP